MECKLLNEYNGIAVGDIVKVVEKHQFYTDGLELVSKANKNYYTIINEVKHFYIIE